MNNLDTLNRRDGIMILGRRVRPGSLAIGYAVLSFFLIFLAGMDMGSACSLPSAILSSWAGLLALRLDSPIEGLIDHYGMNERVAMPIIMAVLLIVFIFLYLLVLFRIIKGATAFRRVAGLIVPLLFHFLGSFLVLTPHPKLDLWMLGGFREAFFYAICLVSFALVVGYIFLSWLIAKRSGARLR
ncbi:MAG: hypothetical protein ABFD52_10925 [Acidobacteriota bacterium]